MRTIFSKFMYVFPFLFLSCEMEDDEGKTMKDEMNDKKVVIDLSNIHGLVNLNGAFVYEAWLVQGNVNHSLGRFTVIKNFEDGTKTLSNDRFDAPKELMKKINGYLISIEPLNDPDPENPSHMRYVSGQFVENVAEISINETIGDFSNSEVGFIMASPTDNQTPQRDAFGVWFCNVGEQQNTFKSLVN